ncbi:helix-turn-helix domain-containing protein [Marinilactibacillus psychrotolerans]|uniref:HTH cro/C1-type domain-containing protein n=1 Tax=Marinilactibacillus psychrotolerans TaxID=191770 RepID=A0AAV3WVM8_9LACT|nr:Rgg/GadR/MutR family transcriptional regulator [Marinilactibacillus psychrotolerans]GEL67052.1 hypothetical protein MPS01_12070 [Marinilactibacillus psychrotolerans]GEQ36197.1 hypothetical protein M132T_17050 [Marinilactibacillus psychrotolerans]SDC77846.1 transcriptional activator, Rgg/GadR/MutR family, C-terminal domain-containing protein [Marinilactibacillus psychrotolerans]
MKNSTDQPLSLDYLPGKTLRKIRESKGYTQKYVAQGIIKQSTYSKIEREEAEPAASKLFTILDRLEMSVGEFLFIQGDYAHSKKGAILYSFVNQKYNAPDELEKLKKEAEDYLTEFEDTVVKDIQSIYESLIVFGRTHDIKLARKYVQPVWDRIEAFDEWQLTEIYLVNNIMFFFSADSAIYISSRAIEQLKKYKGFNDSSKLRYNLKFNLVYLFMDSQKYEEALSALENLIPYTKELKKHDMLAVCYARKGVSMIKSGDESGEDWIDKGLNMLDIIEENELKELLKEEIKSFIN